MDIEKIAGDEGAAIELDGVLFIADEGDITVGKPIVDGAKVKATIVSQGRNKKIIVFKYKNKIRYRRKRGHRQHFTKLMIDDIVLN